MKKREFFIALATLALIVTMIYLVIRTVLFFYSEYTGFEKFLSILLIFGESFVLLHSFGYAINVLRSFKRKSEAPYQLSKLSYEPEVAILVAARHEPKSVLESTFITLKNLNYKNKVIYLLDDSSEEKYIKEAEEISRNLGLVHFMRKERHGAKAGIVNDCLKKLTAKYVAIFDADQNPLPDFLNAIIPIMEKDSRLSFVQTPQFYTNTEESRVAHAAAFQQAVFYEYICEGKSIDDAMFCCGTNMVLRRKP